MKALCLALIPALLLAQKAPVPASYKDLKYPALREIQLPKIDESTLPNGMKLYLLENHELPTIRGTALVRTGNLFDPADKIGLATLTGSLIRGGGTTSKPADQIDEALENIASSVESNIGESNGAVRFSTLKERTDEVLSTFHDVLTSPAFAQDKLDFQKLQLRSGIARRNDEPHSVVQREFADAVYGRDNAYGWQMEYTHLDNIKRDDIVAFYNRYFFPANTILAIQGDFNSAEMKAKIQKLFAGWTPTQAAVPAFPAATNKAKPGIRVAARTDVTQTNFALGHLGGLLNDKDYPALEVMSSILGGGFHSRLFLKVRTSLGYAYDVSASWGANYTQPGLLDISGSTKSASTTETLQAVFGEIKKIRGFEIFRVG